MLHNFWIAAREAGVSMDKFRSNPLEISRAFLESVERYRFDGILVDIDTATLAGAVGVPVDFPTFEPARCLAGCLNDLEEVEGLPPPQVGDYTVVNVWLEAVERLVAAVGDEVLIRGNCDQAPFSLASMMRSPGNWMMDLLDEEHLGRVFELLEYCTVATTQFIELMAQAGAHVVSNGDSPAGPELISPQMYREFALPFEQRVVEVAHAARVPYVLHICGDTEPILDDMVDSEADGLELDYKTDPQIAHDKMRDVATFFGNLDPSGVLAVGSGQLVEEKTIGLLRLFSDTPRFVLNAGCAIPPETPSKNIKTMIATARRFR
jgi:uroporphyrinogen decarboxylase